MVGTYIYPQLMLATSENSSDITYTTGIRNYEYLRRMYNFTKHNPIMSAAMATFLMVPLVLGMFLTLEPTVTIGQTEDFTVRQQITDEIAFTVAPNNVTMDTAILGVSGGTSNGTSTFEITTNNSAGYTVTIAFASSTAMEFETGPEFIPNLTGGPGVFTFDATAVSGTSGFGYTATGPHVVGAMLSDGSTCGSGSANADECWNMNSDATSVYTFVSSSEASDAAGDSYNVHFRVVADGNPNPSLPEGFYTATATLTAANS